MKTTSLFLSMLSVAILLSCSRTSETLQIHQTSSSGDKLADKGRVTAVEARNPELPSLVIHPERQYQEIVGFGGAFTESSASVLNQLSKAKRKEVIRRYFGPDGTAYSLTRTHINSCDFSLTTYAYDTIPGVEFVGWAAGPPIEGILLDVRPAPVSFIVVIWSEPSLS